MITSSDPGGLTTHHPTTNTNTSTQYITYVVGKHGSSATYLHASSSGLCLARCPAIIPDWVEEGKLFCLTKTEDYDLFTELPERARNAYLNRRGYTSPGSQYASIALRAFLLGCRILDYEERRATVISTSPLVISVPGWREEDVVERFVTEHGDVVDVVIDKVEHDFDRTLLHCKPIGSAARGLCKNSSLDFASSNLRIPIVTRVLELYHTRKRRIMDMRLIDRLYSDAGCFGHPTPDRTIVTLTMRDGSKRHLSPAMSEVVNLCATSCPGLAVTGGPGSGKTELGAALVTSDGGTYGGYDALQLLLAPTEESALAMAHALDTFDTGDKRILHIQRMDTMKRSPYSIFNVADKENNRSLAHFERLKGKWEQESNQRERRELWKRMRQVHAAAIAEFGVVDILIGTITDILELLTNGGWMLGELQRQLQHRVGRMILDDGQWINEAALNALILSFPKAQVVLLADSLPPDAAFGPGGVGCQLAGASALQVLARKRNVPIIKLNSAYRAAPTLIRHFNERFYDGQMRTGRTESPRLKLSFIAQHVDKNQMFLNVRDSEAIPSGASLINDHEIAALERIVTALRFEDLDHNDVLVVAMYEAQRQLARTRLPEEYEVITVDEALGREATVVIVLTTSATGDAFIHSEARCALAVSRHREALIVIGAEDMLSIDPWCDVINERDFSEVHFVNK